MGPLHVEARLERPARLDAVHRRVEGRRSGRMEDRQVRGREAERRAEELQIFEGGGAPVRVDDDDRLALPRDASSMESDDAIRRSHLVRRATTLERKPV